MSRKRLLTSLVVISVFLVPLGLRSAVWAEPPEPPRAVAIPDSGDVRDLADVSEPEVLEKGPIHEAFAEPLMLDRHDPLIVSKQPPEPINELPPDEQPTGQNIQWIKGYWAFHEEVDDFVWVSGLWRDVPPGREWVSGEWHETDGAYVWSPGFWATRDGHRGQYVPAPPRSLEHGPSSPAPGDNYLWTPGCWRYQQDQYFWQPGFWYEANADWVWVPSHYCYTARGNVYVDGYWDYPLARRGRLYAPVYWGAGYGGWRVGATYRPRSVINTGLLVASLFVNHHHGHYYYGYGSGHGSRHGHGHGSLNQKHVRSVDNLDRSQHKSRKTHRVSPNKDPIRTGIQGSRSLAADSLKTKSHVRADSNRSRKEHPAPPKSDRSTNPRAGQSQVARQPSRQSLNSSPRHSTLQNKGGKSSAVGNVRPRSVPTPGVRTAAPRTQHRVTSKPSRGKVPHYNRSNSRSVQSNLPQRSRSSAQGKSSSRSIQRSSGKSGNRAGGGGGRGGGGGGGGRGRKGK